MLGVAPYDETYGVKKMYTLALLSEHRIKVDTTNLSVKNTSAAVDQYDYSNSTEGYGNGTVSFTMPATDVYVSVNYYTG